MPSSIKEAGDRIGNALSEAGDYLGISDNRIWQGIEEAYDSLQERYCNFEDPKDTTRALAEDIIANPLAVYITQNNLFPGIFWLGGFTKDDEGVYHAKQGPLCLQQYGGYNDPWDVVFDYATSMRKVKFPFEFNGEDYIFWGWMGDYLNLGAGAELGIYVRMGDTEHYLVDRDLAMPMTLKLVDNEGNIIVDYDPNEKEWYHEFLGIEPNKKNWWITGFNPDYQDIDSSNLTATYTVDFTGNEDMFEAFRSKWEGVYDTEGNKWLFNEDTLVATYVFNSKEE